MGCVRGVYGVYGEHMECMGSAWDVWGVYGVYMGWRGLAWMMMIHTHALISTYYVHVHLYMLHTQHPCHTLHFGPFASKLEGGLICLCSTVAEKHLVSKGMFYKTTCKLYLRCCVKEVAGVGEGGCLVCDCLKPPCITVTCVLCGM